MTDRAAIDAAIARLLADALVRELRAEMAVQTNAPHLLEQAGAQTNDRPDDDQNTTLPPRKLNTAHQLSGPVDGRGTRHPLECQEERSRLDRPMPGAR
jgi:hypothetical protein